MKRPDPDRIAAAVALLMVERDTACTGCHAEPRRPGQRWGNRCHAAYMRAWRKRTSIGP